MKIGELRELSVEELQEKVDEMQDELSNLRIQKATLQMVSPSRIGQVRKSIARIRTLMTEYDKGISKPVTENK